MKKLKKSLRVLFKKLKFILFGYYNIIDVFKMIVYT